MNALSVRLREVGAAGRGRECERGQVIVLFAFVLVGLLLVGALVLDVARVYTVTQNERSVADAAALAGAQDLQGASTTVPSTDDQARARCDAFALLVRELGGSNPRPNCAIGSVPLEFYTDVPNPSNAGTITGTQYQVAIKTPYNGAVSVAPSKAVKVAIKQTNFGLTFGNVVCVLPNSGCSSGAPVWSPTVASVAGLDRAPQYALMTLQPPSPHCNPQGCTDQNLLNDIIVSGSNTALHILQGDIGTNTSADTNQSSSSTGNPACIDVAAGYYLDHYDDLTLPGQTWTWCSANQGTGQNINTLINDPAYPYPTFLTGPSYNGAPVFASEAAGALASCASSLSSTFNSIDTAVGSTLTWTCYQPGVYTSKFQVTSNSAGAYLMPGAYYFPAGMKLGGTLAGGLDGTQNGVDLVFNESASTAGGTLNLNNGNVFLNTAGAVTPARDWDPVAGSFTGTPLQAPGPFLLTIEVIRDNSCFVNGGSGGVVPQLCTTNGNQTVNLAGNGDLQVGGVIYGPSDNMQIGSSFTQQTGTVGQIVSYTVTYSGQATLNQSYPGVLANEVLRLDAACSAGVPCP